MKSVALVILAFAGAISTAGNITVTSPSSGDFLGTTNNVRFLVTGAVVQVTVDVTATLDSNPAIVVTVQRKFDPNADGDIEGTVPLNFAASTPEGAYTLTVVATEPGASYNVVPPIPVNVDVKVPKFGNSNPLAGSYVKGVVPILIGLFEPNVKEWRVRINSGDIPNNSGATSLIDVLWDSASIVTDGAQTINITVEDLAGNKSNKDIGVTVDRINPSSTVLAPTGGANVRPGSRLAIVVEVADQFPGSVHWTGVRVRLATMGDQPLGLVPRRSFSTSGNRLSWTGRVRITSALPDQFKIVVDATDRAGNVAVTQEVVVSTTRRR